KVSPVNTVGIALSVFQQVGQVVLLSCRGWGRKGLRRWTDATIEIRTQRSFGADLPKCAGSGCGSCGSGQRLRRRAGWGARGDGEQALVGLDRPLHVLRSDQVRYAPVPPPPHHPASAQGPR